MEDKRRREALLAEYGEVCNNFRMLTDIRFKLLAFLPIASAAAVVAALVAAMNTRVPEVVGLTIGFALSLFGLVATIGLATYNARNDQLYDELVGRAAAIERELNIPDATFANRPGTWQRIALLGMEWKIDHRTAVNTIYGASITLWLFGVVAFVLEYCRSAYLAADFPSFSAEDSSAWAISVTTTMILIVVTIPIVATFWGSRRMKRKKEERQEKIECLARDAVETAMKEVAPKAKSRQFIQRCAEHREFRKKCVKLAICAGLSGNAKYSDKKKVITRVRARAEFYKTLNRKRLNYYVPQGSEELCASHLSALLTDLSPLWIYDCWTNRKGFMSVKRVDEIGGRVAPGTQSTGTSEEPEREDPLP
jgi:hypothetical protein